MKMIIEGDATEEDIKALATFLRKRWQGRPEHINVMITEGTHTMSKEDLIKFMQEVWKD